MIASVSDPVRPGPLTPETDRPPEFTMTITASWPDVEQSRRTRLLADRVLNSSRTKARRARAGDIYRRPPARHLPKQGAGCPLDLHRGLHGEPWQGGQKRSSLDPYRACIASLNFSQRPACGGTPRLCAPASAVSHAARIARASWMRRRCTAPAVRRRPAPFRRVVPGTA